MALCLRRDARCHKQHDQRRQHHAVYRQLRLQRSTLHRTYHKEGFGRIRHGSQVEPDSHLHPHGCGRRSGKQQRCGEREIQGLVGQAQRAPHRVQISVGVCTQCRQCLVCPLCGSALGRRNGAGQAYRHRTLRVPVCIQVLRLRCRVHRNGGEGNGRRQQLGQPEHRPARCHRGDGKPIRQHLRHRREDRPQGVCARRRILLYRLLQRRCLLAHREQR